MNKNLKLSYIFYFVISAILIAWNTLHAFFNGVAISFVALLGLLFVLLLLIFKDKELFKRTRDLFIIGCVFCALEFFVYFILEFGIGDYSTFENVLGFQSVLSMLGLFYFFYTAFRFILEIKNIRFKFIEILLGNEKFTKKQKKTKEVSNGSLEEKPNQKVEEIKEDESESEIEDADGEIIISEDEE